MKNSIEFLNAISKERPVGSETNQNVLNIIQKEALLVGYDIISLPFKCKSWKRGRSFVEAGGKSYEISASPFSKSYSGYGETLVISTVEELESSDCNEKIVLLQGEITKAPIQPKNFPFYYPDAHKHIIELLEEKQPKAIIAITGKHPMCGLNPFPLFEDGNFTIASAYTEESILSNIFEDNPVVNVCIDSITESEKSNQIIALKSKDHAKGKIIVCAHMDSKYGTPGAIDNAVGVAVMLEVMKSLKGYNGIYNIEFIPFNSEEYYEAKGQLEYLNYRKNDMDSTKLVINIDSPCHKASQTAVSSYNFDKELNTKLTDEIKRTENIVMGEQWYAGDHSMFVYKGIPCIAITSSNLFESVLELTHTECDTLDQINYGLIEETSDFIVAMIKSVSTV